MKLQFKRHIHINASPEDVKSHVADFNMWQAWSPWMVIEPDAKNSVAGTLGQPGHMMRWEGEVIGSGTNTLTTHTDEALIYDLEFLTPWKSRAKITFTFHASEGGTDVSWHMDSHLPMFLFFMKQSMENMIGMDYERGLRMLKSVVEKGSVPATTTNKGHVSITGFSYVGLERTVSMTDLQTCMAKDFDTILQDVVFDGGRSAQNWVTLYPQVDMKNMTFTYIAAISDEGLNGLVLDRKYVRGKVDASKALEISHEGSYEFLGNAWSMGMMIMRAQKLKGNGVPFEQYWNSPKEVSPEELKTSIFLPLQ